MMLEPLKTHESKAGSCAFLERAKAGKKIYRKPKPVNLFRGSREPMLVNNVQEAGAKAGKPFLERARAGEKNIAIAIQDFFYGNSWKSKNYTQSNTEKKPRTEAMLKTQKKYKQRD